MAGVKLWGRGTRWTQHLSPSYGANLAVRMGLIKGLGNYSSLLEGRENDITKWQRVLITVRFEFTPCYGPLYYMYDIWELSDLEQLRTFKNFGYYVGWPRFMQNNPLLFFLCRITFWAQANIPCKKSILWYIQPGFLKLVRFQEGHISTFTTNY